ncbi:putative spermidine/putrescine transport system permease protein [Rhizobium aethiopicum]|uniref:ABC transporter permease n=1 Tax=Rhizobium aethiopicum TaxID=1138170 RepID=UPI00161F49D8|nr:ABC transporter permease subunit [Rhizobium aethiopicum]MBB4581599.1 putative spermidine/putrescine transport system permease protein [Rhizobium aethiopicum]
MTQTVVNRLLLAALLTVCTVWLIIPFGMAILWSLVDPSEPWTPDKLLPPVMSFSRWQNMWENSSLKPALITSYTLATFAALLSMGLSMPTAFAFGRLSFPGKEFYKLVALMPLVVPSFVTAIFFTSILFNLGLYQWRFGAILFAHAIMFMPYGIRILTVSFEQVRQDHIDAARDLGAGPLSRFVVAYLPALKQGIFATLLIVFIQSIEEFAIAYIVGTPTLTTIPILLFAQMGQDFVRPNAAVLSLILVVPNVVFMLLLERLLRSANPSMASGKG